MASNGDPGPSRGPGDDDLSQRNGGPGRPPDMTPWDWKRRLGAKRTKKWRKRKRHQGHAASSGNRAPQQDEQDTDTSDSDTSTSSSSRNYSRVHSPIVLAAPGELGPMEHDHLDLPAANHVELDLDQQNNMEIDEAMHNNANVNLVTDEWEDVDNDDNNVIEFDKMGNWKRQTTWQKIASGMEQIAEGEVEVPVLCNIPERPVDPELNSDASIVGEAFYRVMLQHQVSQTAMDAFICVALEYADALVRLRGQSVPFSAKSCRDRLLRQLNLAVQRDLYKPKVVDNRRVGLIVYRNLHRVPDKLSKVHIREMAYFDLKQVAENIVWPHTLHQVVMPPDDSWRLVDVSIDGIVEGHSSTYTLNMYSVTFNGCGDPFPWRIMRSKKGKDKPKLRDVAGPLVRDIEAAGLKLRHLTCDGKAICFLKGLHGTASAYNSCNLCDLEGTRKVLDLNKQVRTLKTVVYRPGAQGRLRTGERLAQDAVWAQRRQDANARGRKHFRGVMTKSPLLDIPDFDILRQCPIDAMHAQDLGVIKKLALVSDIIYI